MRRGLLHAMITAVTIGVLSAAQAGDFGPPAKPDWQFEVRGSVRGGPVLSEGRVFVGGTEGSVYALRLADGSPIWTAAVGSEVTSALAAAGDRMYVGTVSGHLVCVRAPQVREGIVGVEMWRYGASGAIVAPPLVTSSDTVVFGGTDGTIQCLDRRGRPVWQYRTRDAIVAAPVASIAPTPKFGETRTRLASLVFCCSTDGSIYALREDDGQPVWSLSTGAALHAAPRVLSHAVIAANARGKVLALDVRSGRTIWTEELGSAVKSTPVVADGRVYFACENGSIAALNLQTGKPIWETKTIGPVTTSPILTRSGHLVVIAQPGMIYAIRRADGRVVWADNTGSRISTRGAIGDSHLVFGTETGVARTYVPGGTWHIDPPPVVMASSPASAEPRPASAVVSVAPVTGSSELPATNPVSEFPSPVTPAKRPATEKPLEGVAMTLLTSTSDPRQPAIQVADAGKVFITGDAPEGALRVSLNGSPAQLADGKYWALATFSKPGAYPVEFKFEHGDQKTTTLRRIVIVSHGDTPSASAPIFVSVGPEGQPGPVQFRIGAEGVAEDDYVSVLSIRSDTGATVRAWAETGSAARSFDWDGRDQWGKPLAEGQYVAVYTVKSLDGQSRSVCQPVIVDTAGM